MTMETANPAPGRTAAGLGVVSCSAASDNPEVALSATEVQSSIIALKRDFVCEALDLAGTNAAWARHHLSHNRDKPALEAFDRFVGAVRAAAEQMKDIRAALQSRTAIAEAATEYRQQRGQR